MRAFIVERDFGGVTSGNLHHKMGVKAGETGWVNFENTPVPKENLLGLPDEGFKVAMAALDWGRYTVAGGAVGGGGAGFSAVMTNIK